MEHFPGKVVTFIDTHLLLCYDHQRLSSNGIARPARFSILANQRLLLDNQHKPTCTQLPALAWFCLSLVTRTSRLFLFQRALLYIEVNMSIKAIPTNHNGYHFRSRLEARWAVFFDNMNIEYSYETEGWEVATGVWYLPDFRLADCWVEIKHRFDNDETAVEKMGLLVAGERTPGVIVYGDPLEHYAVLFEPHYLKPGYRRSVANFLQLAGATKAGTKARRAKFGR